jgi:transcriptional regulator with XRE-family HTH domain
MSQTDIARAANMKPSAVSKRESGITKIRLKEYSLWDRVLRLPAGAFEREVEAQQARLDLEARAAERRASSASQSREMAVVRVVLGEIGPIVLEICEHAEGDRRDQMLQEIVNFAEGVASAARASAGDRSRAVVLGPPAKDLHGAHRAYFESEGGSSDAEEEEDRRSAGG